MRLVASKIGFWASLDFYCEVEYLRNFGYGLSMYSPGKEEIKFEQGGYAVIKGVDYIKDEPRPEFYISLKALAVDVYGHCAIEIIMCDYGDLNSEGEIRINIACEAASLNGLGKQLIEWNVDKLRKILWHPVLSY